VASVVLSWFDFCFLTLFTFFPILLRAAGARKAAGQPRRRKKLVVEQVSPTLGSSKSKGAR
jgi:hypothetical protein